MYNVWGFIFVFRAVPFFSAYGLKMKAQFEVRDDIAKRGLCRLLMETVRFIFFSFSKFYFIFLVFFYTLVLQSVNLG